MLLLRRNSLLFQGELHAELEQSSSGAAGRAGTRSVPGSHTRGGLSSTSRPGCSRSAWPRCRCSPGCCTLHTQTQACSKHCPAQLENTSSQLCPDVRHWGAEGSPSPARNCNHNKPGAGGVPPRLQRDQPEAQQARARFRKWHLPDNKPLFQGKKYEFQEVFRKMTLHRGLCSSTERTLGFKSVSQTGSLLQAVAGHGAMVLNWKRAILD